MHAFKRTTTVINDNNALNDINCLNVKHAVVDFRSLPLFKKTIYAAHVNLFTRLYNDV